MCASFCWYKVSRLLQIALKSENTKSFFLKGDCYFVTHTYILQKVMGVHFILDTTPTQETWWGANNGGEKFRIKDNLKQKKWNSFKIFWVFFWSILCRSFSTTWLPLNQNSGSKFFKRKIVNYSNNLKNEIRQNTFR